MALTPYTGQWTKDEASHLLRRTLFGPTLQQINDSVGLGLAGTVSQLLTIPAFTQPLAFLPEETIIPYGSSWIFGLYPSDDLLAQNHEIARRDSLTAWMYDRINHESFSIHEKMCLFWQNHFASKPATDSRATYKYFNLIQQNCLGNFKTLVKEITINPCILMFLNGDQNTAISPNENFAREILELYTIGKGPLIGAGDYTNYTEQDVQAGAKIFTGWTNGGFLSSSQQPMAVFQASLHDASDKILSYHFNNAVVSDAGSSEYLNYIDIIFQQNEVANFICRKLYRWFVNYAIDTSIETNIIAEMANTLLSNNYEIQPVIEELLMSNHFYDMSFRGSIIKNPLELIFSILNSSNSYANFNLNSKYRMYLNIHNSASLLGQNYVMPPNVAGWSAYYQSPDFSKLWVNASYISLRIDFAKYLNIYGGIVIDFDTFEINHLGFLDNLSLPSDPSQVINDIVLLFFPKGITNDKFLILKGILTNGLPDFEWTLLYNDYLANSGNSSFSDPVKQRVSLTLDQVFSYPEFQTI